MAVATPLCRGANGEGRTATERRGYSAGGLALLHILAAAS